MTVLLLANIGNSDLVVEGAKRGDLPREARRLAAHIEANRETYWPRIRLPILTKALDYVLAQEEAIETVILFVSDQDRALVGEAEWAKDTCGTGKIIREKVIEQYREQGLTAKKVRLHTIPGNPADYDTMLAYFERELPRIHSFYTEAVRAYLSLTGGTPAMNAMLLVVGNEVFGPQTVNLYDSRERKRPFPLGVGRRLAERALRTALHTNLQTFQYAAALALVEREGPALVDAHSSRQVLTALLTYARDRLAFNFGDAVRALETALPHTTSPVKEHLLAWQEQVLNPDERDRLRELYFGAEIKRLNHAYAGWLERVFRFQESALRYAAVEHGVRFRDPNLEYLDRNWVAAQPGLTEHLAQAPLPGGGRGLDPKRSASRPLLRGVLAYLAEERDDERLRRFLNLSDRLESLAALRNHWVHRSRGIRQADLEDAFGGSVEEASGVLAEMFDLLTGDPMGDNPYNAINDLCRALLRG
ncbi:MAG TPA: hypothetical protein ENJ31_10990 [Anaerolineae bacterium]|nr:hypothetical protein [Anaerolineae bacterium]